MAAEGQPDRMASEVKVHMKQKTGIEFLHVKKMAPVDTDPLSLNIYGDQTVDISTVKQWVMCFTSGDSDVKDKPSPRWP